TCHTAVSGIATTCSGRPATVTREKTRALTGNNIASAATDAANIAASGLTRRGIARPSRIGTTTRIANVAPNVSTNAGSATVSGAVATRSAPTKARVFNGGLR